MNFALLTAAAEKAPADYSNLFVVLMGLGTVFVGLICIIVLCTISGAVIQAIEGKKKIKQPQDDVKAPAAAPAAAPVAAAPARTVIPCDNIPNRGAFVAAVSAALAEDLGTDVSSIRIMSIGKEITPDTPIGDTIKNRGEFVAAVSAALAEEIGTDVSKIRIQSIRLA